MQLQHGQFALLDCVWSAAGAVLLLLAGHGAAWLCGRWRAAAASAAPRLLRGAARSVR